MGIVTPGKDPAFAFPEEIRSWIRRAKGLEGDPPVELEVRSPEIGAIAGLRPVTCRDADDPSVLEPLTEWRERHTRWFLTQFQPTVAGTRDWLRERVLADDARLLFLVTSPEGQLQGHYGIFWSHDRVLELDNAILGVSGVPKRLFHFVELTILSWAFRNPGVEKVIGRVFSHNQPALMLHTGVGLVVEASHGLARVEEGDSIAYEVTLDEDLAGRVPFRMKVLSIARDRFLAMYPWSG